MLRIVTDSTCDLPEETVSSLGITVVPLHVRINSRDYRERIELSREDFYEQLKNARELPVTSQPAPGEFFAVYEEIVEKKDSVISLHISTKLSGTYNSAMSARNLILDEWPDADITVIDSLSASWGLGILVIKAAEMARDGFSKEEVLDWLKPAALRSKALVLVGGLDHLYRGGRLSRTQAFIGGLMNVIPVILLEHGSIRIVDKALGTKAAIAAVRRIMPRIARDEPPEFITALWGTMEKEGMALGQLMRELYPGTRLATGMFGAVIGTHVGIVASAVMWF